MEIVTSLWKRSMFIYLNSRGADFSRRVENPLQRLTSTFPIKLGENKHGGALEIWKHEKQKQNAEWSNQLKNYFRLPRSSLSKNTININYCSRLSYLHMYNVTTSIIFRLLGWKNKTINLLLASCYTSYHKWKEHDEISKVTNFKTDVA